MKSNGRSPYMAALQLFAHLDGEALQVALLMPDRIRERWKDLENELTPMYSMRNSTLDPIMRSERDGGLRAPLGHNIGVARR